MNADVCTTSMIEHCIVGFEVSQAVNLEDARRLRGAISNVMQRPEFHNHLGQKLSYGEPLIRYVTSSGRLNAVGICNGAMLLKELPRFQSLRLGRTDVDVHRQTATPSRVEVGAVEKSIRYRFVSPTSPVRLKKTMFSWVSWQKFPLQFLLDYF